VREGGHGGERERKMSGGLGVMPWGAQGKRKKKDTRFRILASLFFSFNFIKKNPFETVSFLKSKESRGKNFVDLTLIDLGYECLGWSIPTSKIEIPV